MRTVWKFLLGNTTDPQSLLIPDAGEILLVHGQGGRIGVWVEVDENAPKQKRWFIITPTGGQVPFNGEYVGTAFLGVFVWHVWELEGQE
jgi:hypothetical protein